MTRDEIIEKNLPLVTYTLRKYFAPNACEWDDLFQEGCIGLIQAVDRFNPDLGYTFSTYACRLIWGRATNYLRDKTHSIRPPRGAAPMAVCSLDQESAEGLTLAAIVPAAKTDDLDTLIDFDFARQRLNGKERKAIDLKARRDLYQCEIGEALEVSQSQASRIIKKATDKLRRAMA